jgi:hypothetical protein
MKMASSSLQEKDVMKMLRLTGVSQFNEKCRSVSYGPMDVTNVHNWIRKFWGIFFSFSWAWVRPTPHYLVYSNSPG